MKTAEEVIGELDWTPLKEMLEEHGEGAVKLRATTNGIVAELVAPSQAEKAPFRLLTSAHCATCQCNKLHSTAPVPGNPLSRSWHDT